MPLLFLILLIIQIACGQKTGHSQLMDEDLTEFGSEKIINTVFTNPGEDCSTSMNISWVTPPGVRCEIEVTNEDDGFTYTYEEESLIGFDVDSEATPEDDQYEFPYIYYCDTFNDIPSKLRDNTSVNEMHIFDKHGFELYDLEPNTEYSYRIVARNDSTNEKEYSDIYRFCTAGADSWKAAIIGDFHHYSPLWSRLESAMGMLDVIDSISGGYDWVLSTGDVAAWGGSFNFWTELSEQPNFKNYMWATVQGNHDHTSSDKIASDDFFRDSHYFPYNGYEGQEGVSYWFKYGDVLFLMLNNEAIRLKDGLHPALAWIEKVVNENPSKYIVVVEHYQWIIGTDGETSLIERFYPTFDKLGVDLAISGNNHVYLRTLPLKDKSPVEPEEGTFYVVTPSSDNSRGRDIKRLVANGDIIETRWSEGTHTIGGMLMDVNPERIEMTLYDRYGEAHDSFTVPAKR